MGSVATWVRDWLVRIERIGQTPEDDPRTRRCKRTLVVAAIAISLLAFAWIALYLSLGRPLAAAIPLTYQLASLVGLAWFARSHDLRRFGATQMALMVVLPFVLQWTLGGFENASAVMLWAFVAPMAAMSVLDMRAAWLTFAAFVGLTVVSGLVDPALAASATPIPEQVQRTLFVLDILGVSVVTFVVLTSFVRSLDRERDRSDRLLANVFPGAVAERLKRGDRLIADRMDGATILFADIVGFSPLAARLPPARLVELLGAVFRTCDGLADRHGLETIKTIGDCYMAAAGAPLSVPDHARRAADMALDLMPAIVQVGADLGCPLQVRIGIHSGEVVAGVIGERRFAYDLWGPVVNLASRLESHGVAGGIQVSAATRALLGDAYELEPRGPIDLKGIGPTEAWLLIGRAGHPAGAPTPAG